MANKPQIRFQGHQDEWKEKSLSEMGKTYTGLSGKTKDDFGHGEGQFVPYVNVFNNPITNPKKLETVEIDNNQNQVKKGDVFFTTSSETPDEVGMSSVCQFDIPNVYLNSFCFGYRPTAEVDLNYLAYYLRSKSFRDKIKILAQGISRYNISKKKVVELNVNLPSPEEQAEIGNFLTTLDKIIALRETELEKLRQLKAACLDKMFANGGAKQSQQYASQASQTNGEQ